MSSQGIPEVEISLIPPSKGRTIASLSRSNIIVPTRSITNVVDKLIRASPIVLVGMFAVLGLREGEVALAGRFELRQLVDLVLRQQATVVIADVAVTASAV